MSSKPHKNERRDAEAVNQPELAASKVPAWTLWLAVAWLLIFFRFFFSIDLPNSMPTTNRSDLWLDLPDLLISCVVQDADATPTRWAYFVEQRLWIVLLAGAILVVAVALGRLVLRAISLWPTGHSFDDRSIERNTMAAAVGLSGLSLLTLGCGLLAQVVPGAMSRGTLATALAGFVLL